MLVGEKHSEFPGNGGSKIVVKIDFSRLRRERLGQYVS